MDYGPLPRRPGTKIAFIVISIAVVLGLCVLSCVIARDLFDAMLCPLSDDCA